jgi:hypothetical protein
MRNTAIKYQYDKTEMAEFEIEQILSDERFYSLIDGDSLETLKLLPDNLTELGKRYLEDIADSLLAIPNANDIVQKLIKKLDKRKTAAHIKDISDKVQKSTDNNLIAFAEKIGIEKENE